MNKNLIYEKLRRYGQLHLLNFTEELTPEREAFLYSQIEKADFSVIDLISDKVKENFSHADISPIDVLETGEINAKLNFYREKGIKALKENKTALVLLAGGQSSRLGFDKPKGMLNIGISKEYFLFQHHIGRLKKTSDEIGCPLHLFIMTSPVNDGVIREFFKDNHFFAYDSNYIHFFAQDCLPSVDFNGKILMESKSSLCFSPDGNGKFYNALVNAGFDKILKDGGIEWLNVFAVDNALQVIADPVFTGAVLDSGCNSGAKVIKKSAPDERVGMICRKNNKPGVIEYYELPKELGNYNFGVILNYLFKVEKLEEARHKSMPVHLPEKKVNFTDTNGERIIPTEPNAYKFEFLLTDMVELMDSCLPFEVAREKEFAPIKNKTGGDSLETAREMLRQNGYELT